jgi:glycosyltransferase involved in cell wall biosynthesis
MNSPLVSIIVPLYNHAQYITASLESFANEGHPNLEVVVIDDGSKDKSFEVAQAWFAQHLNTLNRLVARANGEFITMVASDDLLLPGGIQTRLEALERHPDWLGVFGDATVIDAQGIQTATSALRKINGANLKALELSEFRAKEMILRWSVPGPVLLYRRQTIEIIGNYDETMILEDRDFYLRLLARKALGFVKQPVAAYRLHARNTIRLMRVRHAVYEAVYRSEINHLHAFENDLYKALEFSAQRSKMHLGMSKGNWAQMVLVFVSIAVNSIHLHQKLFFHDLQVAQTREFD